MREAKTESQEITEGDSPGPQRDGCGERGRGEQRGDAQALGSLG